MAASPDWRGPAGIPRVIQIAHWPRSGLTAVMRDVGRALAGRAAFTFVELGAERTSDYYGDLGRHVALDFQRHPAAALRRLAALIRSSGADLVHAHSLQPLFWTALLRRRRTAVVSTVHSEYPYLTGKTTRDAGKRAMHRIALARARPRVVAVTDKVVAMLAEAGLAGPSVASIENAIVPLPAASLPAVRRASRAALGVAADELLVVSAGRLHREKGFDLLIAAFAAVKRERPTARLIIAGEGAERANLERQIQAAGLASCVALPGHVSPLLDFLAAADLFVLSSRYEGCPLALPEAMSCAVVPVATPVGTAPSLLQGRYDELLAARIDADALGAAITRALSPEVDRIRLGAELSEIARRRFDLAAFGDRYWAVYEAALREARR